MKHPSTVTLIVKFIRKRILIHEDCYLFYLCIGIFFDIITNSTHEGTNFSMKNHTANILPSMSLTTFAITLAVQATMKDAVLDQVSISDFSVNQHWLNLPILGYLVTAVEGILHSQKRIKYYCTARTDKRIFDIFYNDNLGENYMRGKETTVSLPLFFPTRKVKIDNNKVVKCSCCIFEQTGLPCIHIYCVFSYIDPCIPGFIYHNVALCWRSVYLYYGYNKKYAQASILILYLFKHDIRGALLTASMSELSHFFFHIY